MNALKGVCPVCQQQDIEVRYFSALDLDEQDVMRAEVESYVLAMHQFYGEWCSGAGDTPQAVYKV